MTNLLKSIVSYLAMFFGGMYFLCLCDGERDFFIVLGFIVCITLAIISGFKNLAQK